MNAPQVVCETIDGEAVIMNLKSGNYYSSDRVGAAIWAWIEEALPLDEIERRACARYTARPEEIKASIAAFVERLVAEELVREAEGPDEGSQAATSTSGLANDLREVFVAPELERYTDMQDLLLLDPIHDVDDTGWPKAKGDKRVEPV